MNYSSTRTVESKTCEGVRFTLRRMTWWQREELNEQQGPIAEKIREARAELDQLDARLQKARETAQETAKPERDRLIAEGLSEEEAAKRVPLKIDFPDDQFRRW